MNNKERPLYARNFSYLKNRKNITREDIFLKTGIPVSTWGSYEEGRAFPHWEKLLEICDMLEFWDIHAILTKDLALTNPAVISNAEAIAGLVRIKEFLEGMKK